ncbi:MAG: hypothetical protein Q9217_001926 [Psora testacea]
MYLPSSLLLLCGTLSVVWSNAVPQVTSPPQKRDDGEVVLNLGPISNFQKTTTGVPAPSGTSVVIYPTDAQSIPEDGIYILLGPEIQKSLQDTVKADCANVNDVKCLESISTVFKKDNSDLQRRGTPWISLGRGAGQVGLVFESIVAYLTAKWEFNSGEPQTPPLHIHIPSSALSQINSASSASTVVFKTADNDPSAVSVPVTAPGPDPGPSRSAGPLTTATADGDGYAKGDIEVDLPSDDAANALNDFFHKSECQAPPAKRGLKLRKRDPDVVECLVAEAQDILSAMGVNQALNALAEPAMQVAQNFPLPSFADQDYSAAFGQFVVWAGEAVPNTLQGIAQPQIIPATIFIFMLAVADYGQKFMNARRLFLQVKTLLDDKDFALVCPKEDSKFYPSCDKFFCQGKDGRCTTDLMKPCACGDGKSSKCPTDFSEVVSCDCVLETFE